MNDSDRDDKTKLFSFYFFIRLSSSFGEPRVIFFFLILSRQVWSSGKKGVYTITPRCGHENGGRVKRKKRIMCEDFLDNTKFSKKKKRNRTERLWRQFWPMTLGHALVTISLKVSEVEVKVSSDVIVGTVQWTVYILSNHQEKKKGQGVDECGSIWRMCVVVVVLAVVVMGVEKPVMASSACMRTSSR